MKKYLYLALALPMMFACSSDDLIEKGVVSNDQFPGVQKVDATLFMDEGQGTRFDGNDASGEAAWRAQEGDLWGFAWMGDGTVIATNTGKAYQNHNLIQTDGIFKPQTSIYVGKYYIYRPYDKTTVSPQAINFKSLEEQTLAAGYESTTQAWKDLAKTAINIGDVWTDVSVGGTTFGTDPTIWNKAGVKGEEPEKYKIYAAMFSNQTGLDLTYKKNNPSFTAATPFSGATDIDYIFAAGQPVGAADIYEVTVDLDGAAKSFTYAPTASPNGIETNHSGTYWADKSNLGAGEGFTFTDDVITLTPADAVNGLSTGDNEATAWFWFNSLPVTAGGGNEATAVQTVLTTSYGVVTVNKTLEDCAYAFEQPDGAAADAPKEWIKIVSTATDQSKSPKEWNLGDAGRKTFVNQYGNHKGKYTFDVDFSLGVMNGMDIKNDAHLQKLLKYYLASNKTNEANVVLNLLPASATDNTFKLSKISIALLQTINAGATSVKVDATGLDKVIVTQDGQAALDLADKKEVPTLNNVFNTATDVALSKDCEWTWKERTGANQLTVDAGVASLTNEGNLTVNATNIQLSTAAPLANAANATMNITKLTTVKNTLTNLGTINVGAADNTSAELRAYDIVIANDATALGVGGTINNYGAVGVSDIGTSGKFNNYSVINVMNAGAITLLSTNELVSDFDNHFDAATNKMGTVNLPSPTALVSVANTDANGFIKYTWPADTKTYVTPEGNVKYNTIVVSGDIQFTEIEAEIKYIEFNGTRTQVINNGYLKNLLGVMVNAGKSIIIEKGNTLVPKNGTYLGAGATVYKGGIFTHNATVDAGTTNAHNYFGDWQTTQIVKY